MVPPTPPTDSAILDPILIGVLQQHLLTLLAPADLTKLAASCRGLQELVLSTGPDLWHGAVKRALPWHPDLPANVPALQAIMQKRASCCSNLAKGRCRQQVCQQMHYELAPKLAACDIHPSVSRCSVRNVQAVYQIWGLHGKLLAKLQQPLVALGLFVLAVGLTRQGPDVIKPCPFC